MAASLARVPCTIVTGFLGAGKTTLIRHVLTHAQGRRLAVIVNEFGDVGIDGDILKGCGDSACPEENIVELANGCLCCTVADEFVPALDTILSRRPAVEHIVIETSGLALPKPLVQAFRWPEIRNRVTVDGVVAVVDGAALADGRVAADLAALARQRAADASLDHDDPVEEVFADQLACADLVVLNKRDLLDPARLDAALAALTAALSRKVSVITAAGGRIDPVALLGLGIGTEADIDNRRTHHDLEPEHDHDDFDSFVVPLPEIGDPAALAERVAALADAHGVFRVKGFVAVTGKPMRLLLQAVGTRVSHQYDRAWTASDARTGAAGGDRPQGSRPRRHHPRPGGVRHAPAHHHRHHAGGDRGAGRPAADARRRRGDVVRRQRPGRARGRVGGRETYPAEHALRAAARSAPPAIGGSVDRDRSRSAPR